MRAKYILTGLVNIILTITLILLGLRLILRLFGADPEATFVSWLYATSEPIMGPFEGMFPSPTIDQGMVLEFSTIFAIFIYSLLAWLITELIYFVSDASQSRNRRNRHRENYVDDDL